ncbi:putative acyclic terpene utilization [Helianthus annuus]|nr:putative acyclic terpene utilization [Helianthus annuus]
MISFFYVFVQRICNTYFVCHDLKVTKNTIFFPQILNTFIHPQKFWFSLSFSEFTINIFPQKFWISLPFSEFTINIHLDLNLNRLSPPSISHPHLPRGWTSPLMDSCHCLTDALRLSYRRTTRQPSSLLEPSLLHSLLQPWAVPSRSMCMRASGDPYLSVGRSNYLGGDKPLAALKLLQKVDDLNYLVLECSAERTLADRYQEVLSGGEGFDPRISEWMQLLLPLAVEKGVCTITNMGAKKVLEIASGLGIKITVGVAHQFDSAKAGLCSNLRNLNDSLLDSYCCHIDN